VANQALGVYGEEYAVETLFAASFQAISENISIELTLNKNGNSNAQGWLNYIRLHARRRLNMRSSPLFFRDTQSTGTGNISNFSITNASNVQVWDITDPHDIKQMKTSLSGTTLSFAAATDTLREFVAFRLSDGLLSPVLVKERLNNQHLHDMDAAMVIVTHPDFMTAAEELAQLHREKDGLSVEVVTDRQVYHEFSSGKQDPAAIRNFVKTMYQKSGKLKYLLLMGDGSFDNKSNIPNTVNSNYIVTYQSAESLHTTQSYVSDDYFGILADGEHILGGNLKIGVGRLPVQSAEEAQNVVNKIKRYMEMPVSGNWANLMGLLADDEDMNMHTAQSDSIAAYLRQYQPQYTVDKLYFDAFPQIPTADGHRYPEVVERLDNLLNNGCFLVNYIGHGNATGLSEERVVNADGIDKWKNKILPLFVVATCEFGRYDDYRRTTAGEKTVLNPSGGGIALLTSTRLVYSSLNFQFTKNFFRALFLESFSDAPYRLGDFVRLSKNASSASVNKLCFTLFGDPALKLPIPLNKVRTVSVNGLWADTLRANAKVSVKAEIVDGSGQKMSSFNGTVHVSLFDKASELSTLNNDHNAAPMTFETQTSFLYKGKATVRNGAFDADFIMPRDINYQYGFGKLTYFAYSEDAVLSAGAFEEIVVGGSDTAMDDFSGPDIRLFMNDTLFRDGGITDQNPVLMVYLRDESGINTTGGIGHRITARLNHDPSNTYYLDDYYEAEADNYRKGQVMYRFFDLPAGQYELEFTAWDVANNSAQSSIRFQVTRSGILQMANLRNYPNPFSDHSYIYFEYNFPGEAIDVEMQIFDLSGRQLRTIRQSLFSDGYTSGLLQWDGHDGHGNSMNNGIYPYRIILRTAKGQEVRQTAKMVLLRY
jgi:hypothetical protein